MNLDPDWQSLYIHIGRLLETAPDMSTSEVLKSPQILQWIGRAQALVDQCKVGGTSFDFDLAVAKFPYTNWRVGVQEVFTILYRVLGHCELRVPAGLSGTFVPIGNQFDAFAAVAKICRSASKDVFIVDPYLDEAVLTDFGAAVPEGILLRLLTDSATVKPGLAPAAQRWVKQYSTTRPLAVRLAKARTLHDRVIFIDGIAAWTITQSLKDLAKRSPAEIIRTDDVANLKIPAYQDI
jgi:hypothetical protein